MTATRWSRRALAGMGMGALVASVTVGVVGVGAGEAQAAPVSATGSVSVSTDLIGQWIDTERTVSSSSVAAGATVTVTTVLKARKTGSGIDATLKNFQDWTPSCMTYVAGTGKAVATNTVGGPSTVNAVAKTGYIEADPSSVWGMGTGATARNVTLTADYVVNCPVGQQNTGGLNAYVTPGNGLPIKYWLDERGTGTGVANPPSGLKTSGPTITVTAAQTAPAAPVSATVSPASATAGQTVTVSGKAAADTDTIVVKVGNDPVVCSPAAVAANGDFQCTFPAAAGGTVTVAGKNAAGTGPSKNAGDLTVNPADPDAPTVTVTPAPKAGQESTIKVSVANGAAGDAVTIKVNGQPVCPDLKLAANRTANCTWTPSSAGSSELKVTVNGKTTTQTVTVANAGGGNGNGNGGSSEGSLGSSSGSLSGLFGSS